MSDITKLLYKVCRPSIKQLRALGGTWEAIQEGFGSWAYEGVIGDHSYKVYARAVLSPKYDGDDESYSIRWYVEKDGKLLQGFEHPMELIQRDLNMVKFDGDRLSPKHPFYQDPTYPRKLGECDYTFDDPYASHCGMPREAHPNSDFLDEIIEESTLQDPDFPEKVEEARRKV